MRFELQQYRWFRKWNGGTWYYYSIDWLSMAPFWTQDPNITSCGARVVRTESYPIH